MRQRLGIIITIVLAIGVLVAINSFAYVAEQKEQESEFYPNRSTYSAGATGTKALHDFLNESGYKVMRWREPIERLLSSSGQSVQTFVIIGRPRVEVDEEEAKNLMLWVERGGRLVIIDRRPDDSLLPVSGDWKITTEYIDFPSTIDPGSPEQMTQDVRPISPAQPTRLTRDIESVMPSRFISTIKFFPVTKDTTSKANTDSSANENADGAEEDSLGFDEPSTDGPPPLTILGAGASEVSPAPVVHLVGSSGPLLVDYPHGKGTISLLAEPFIVTNIGIGLKDNLKLSINLLALSDGLIAFDEFHQGRGTTHNEFVGYFEGTPVLAICGQIVLLILLIVWTRGRRFARPLPLPAIDRRSSLEFVASMAELQQRARAYDLAIENIYSRTRRVLARYAGVDYNSSRREIAERVGARSTIKPHQLDTLMRQAEEAINGGSISERQAVALVKRLREVEGSLGLRMRSRQEKQAAQNI
ncbi:MAG TPA: DUF4350 domain-containing protein [Pyrinomonadaceae bacterium]|jgi:hypothetical protein